MTYKFLFLTAALFWSATAFTDELAQNKAPRKKNEEPFEQGMALPSGKYPAAYNAPSSIYLKNAWDFDVFGSFIYWYATQDDMDIAYVPPSFPALPAVAESGSVLFQRFKYEPGFKVGFGFDTNYDSWAFRAEYIWLHETINTPATAAPLAASGAPRNWNGNDWFDYPTIVGPLTLPLIASSWKLKLDMVDAVMSRPFYQGTRLSVTPFGGLRGLWLSQKMNITGLNALGDAIATLNNRSTSWALGPVTGVGGHWLLGSGFRFEGNAAAALLYTRYTSLRVSESEAGFATSSSSIQGLSAVRPIAQLNLGIGWGMYFHGCTNDTYLDISLDYEFLEFWSQNMMRKLDSFILGFSHEIGDLQMHGLTATVRFDF